MTLEEFYEHVKKCAGIDSPEEWNDTDDLFGYFGHFRPDGQGLEEVFKPVEEGDAYVARLRELFEATMHAEAEVEDYFVMRQPLKCSKPRAIEHGSAFLANLRLLAVAMVTQREEKLAKAEEKARRRLKQEMASAKELQEVLAGIESVEIVNGPLGRGSDEQLVVYEVVGDFFIDQSNYDDFIPRLGEAYYSMACDYDLKRYLMWPYFKNVCAADVFQPYFELWKHGYAYEFNGAKLLLAKG